MVVGIAADCGLLAGVPAYFYFKTRKKVSRELLNHQLVHDQIISN